MSRKTSYNNKMQINRLKVSTQDAVGGIVQVKVTVFSTSCRIRQLKASEQSVGGKDGTVSTHRVYSNTVDIKNKDELIIDNKVYDINTVNPGSFNKDSIEIDVTYRG